MKFPPSVGGWISDGKILLSKWEHGMDMRALNYCVNERTGRFINMRAILGHEDIIGAHNLYLQLHGGRGGKCRRWVLNDNDYITQIHYTYDWYDGFINKV